MTASDLLQGSMAAAIFVAWAGLSYRSLRRPRQRRGDRSEAHGSDHRGSGGLLVVYASQNGAAAALARAEVARLAAHGPELLPLSQLSPERLAAGGKILFILSTTGAGDAPDMAQGFVSQVMSNRPDLARLDYAVLGLGDRRYGDFCGFAQRVADWLAACGASQITPMIRLDREAPDALQLWRAAIAADPVTAAALPVAQLIGRERLTPDQGRGGLWRLTLQPEARQPDCYPDWQPGDVVRLGLTLRTNRVIWREYSIASLAQSGKIELVLRAVIGPDGVPGQGSQHLTQELPLGGQVSLQLRPSPQAAPPATAPLILIGAGAGIAGVIGFLRQRAAAAAAPDAASAAPNWLIFGERDPAHDLPLAAELRQLQQTGVLQHLDLAFSRGAEPGYVQDLLQAEAARLRDWLDRGAVIIICGRQSGMGEAVITALRALMGAALWARVLAEARLRRDLY